ncbi:MAG: HIT family protein [Minisyncoccota bacterium]
MAMAEYDSTLKGGECVFCDIVRQNDLRKIFWQDDTHVAFLAIDPNTPGFSVVIPKAHLGSDVLKMGNDELSSFVLAAKQVSKILEDYYDDVGRVGLIMEGTGVDHAHIKLFPMHGTEHLKRGEWRQQFSDVEHWFDTYEGWISSAGGPLADASELAELTRKIRESIKQS